MDAKRISELRELHARYIQDKGREFVRIAMEVCGALPELLDEIERLQKALRGTVQTMEMQEQRESGAFHIAQPTAKYLWDEAKEAAKKLLP
jgi:hypothetical protein